jgi:uncharacterized membrane protein
MRRNSSVFWVTSTAIFIALLVVAQVVTSAFGNTIVTGSVNNLLMILAVMLLGLSSGVTVATISPILAKLIGIGPLWSLIPFIIAGNLVLVLIWNFLGKRHIGKKYLAHILALAAAAVAKFLVLYIGIVRVAVPFLLGLPEKQAAVISGMFSVPQLITATIGGVLATLMLPVLEKAVKK